MSDHPIRRPEVIRAIEEWTETLLRASGSGTVTISFNVHEGNFVSMTLGGGGSRTLLTSAEMRLIKA